MNIDVYALTRIVVKTRTHVMHTSVIVRRRPTEAQVSCCLRYNGSHVN